MIRRYVFLGFLISSVSAVAQVDFVAPVLFSISGTVLGAVGSAEANEEQKKIAQFDIKSALMSSSISLAFSSGFSFLAGVSLILHRAFPESVSMVPAIALSIASIFSSGGAVVSSSYASYKYDSSASQKTLGFTLASFVSDIAQMLVNVFLFYKVQYAINNHDGGNL